MLFWTLTLALVVIAYVLLIVWILPKFMLKSNYPIPQPTDRGLKKYKFSDSDYAVVYEPSLSARKYITQYVLAKKDGKKAVLMLEKIKHKDIIQQKFYFVKFAVCN